MVDAEGIKIKKLLKIWGQINPQSNHAGPE